MGTFFKNNDITIMHKAELALVETARRKRRVSEFIAKVEEIQNSKAVEFLTDGFWSPLTKLQACGNEISVCENFDGNLVFLSNETCKLNLICPNCAARKAIKYSRKYFEKYQLLKERNPKLRAYYCYVSYKLTDKAFSI